MIFYPEYFSDVGANPGILTQFNPCEVLKAADRENSNILQTYMEGGVYVGMTRKVVYYVPSTGVRRELELMLVEHNGTSLTDIESDSVATHTASAGKAEGRVLRLGSTNNTFGPGTGGSADDPLGECLGVMLGYHVRQGQGGRRYNSTTREELGTIADGDWHWVIRKGKVPVLATENTVLGEMVINDSNEWGCGSSSSAVPAVSLGVWLATNSNTGSTAAVVEAAVDFTNGANPST